MKANVQVANNLLIAFGKHTQHIICCQKTGASLVVCREYGVCLFFFFLILSCSYLCLGMGVEHVHLDLLG